MKNMQQSDHDLLLTLITKFDALSDDVKEMNDGMRNRIRGTEVEVRTIQTIIDKVNPLETYDDCIIVKNQVKTMRDNFKLISVILGFFGAFILWASGVINNIIGIFNLIIAIAGGLAVLKIIYGGIQYMSTDAFGAKNEAKDTIKNAIWGLLLAISAWLILYTVNPNLVEINLDIPRQGINPDGGGGR